MSRFGYGTALDLHALGIGGGGSSCDFSTYYNGTSNVNIPFVDDGGGNMVPELGPIHIQEDNLDGVLSSSKDMTGDWTITQKIQYDSNLATIGYSTIYSSSVDDSEIRFYILGSNGKIEFNIRDSANVSRFFNQSLDYTLGTVVEIEMKKIGTTVTVTNLTTTESKSATVDLTTNGCDVDTLQVGYGSATFRMDGYFYSLSFVSSFYTEEFDFVGRLWPVNDPNYNTFTGTDGTVLTIFDDVPYGMVFPYYPNTVQYNQVDFLGDSITVGADATTDYPTITEDFYDNVGLGAMTWTNRAQGGKTSVTFAPTGFDATGYPTSPTVDPTRNVTFALANGAELIVWYLTQNDNTFGFSLSQSEDVLDATIQACQDANVPIIIFTGTPRYASEPTEATWANDWSDIVRAKGLPYVDVNVILGLGGANNYADETLFATTVHPNDAGQNLIAEGLKAVLNEDFQFLTYLISDTPCTGNNLQLIDGIAQRINGVWQYI